MIFLAAILFYFKDEGKMKAKIIVSIGGKKITEFPTEEFTLTDLIELLLEFKRLGLKTELRSIR